MDREPRRDSSAPLPWPGRGWRAWQCRWRRGGAVAAAGRRARADLGGAGARGDGEAPRRGTGGPRRGRCGLARCRPIYVRYRPGRYCRVLYEVRFRDPATGAATDRLAHAALLRGDRAERLWARGEPRQLAERAAELHPGPPAARAAYVPALRAVAQVYPVDLDLPGLVEAAAPEVMRERLGDALAVGRALRRVEPELVRYKPRRRAVLRIRLEGGPRQAVYAKARADERGALIHRSAARSRSPSRSATCPTCG